MIHYHLVVLVHGLWGNPAHMNYLASQVKSVIPKNPDEQLIIYKTGCHSGYLTYDGIDVNGKRISVEIRDKVGSLDTDQHQVTKLSLIGYSMGGLVSRYALGVLYHEGFFDNIKAEHFATFCTPHVGAKNPSGSLSARFYNMFAPKVLVHTGSQMFLQDKCAVGSVQVPLLVWMADPASDFYKALLLFSARHLYANTINDKRTGWYTSFISGLDPFHLMVNENLSAYNLKYVQGYAPTVIDFSKSIEFCKVERPAKSSLTLAKAAFKVWVWTRLILYATLLAPLYSLYVLGNAVHQRIKLRKRLNQFSSDAWQSMEVLYRQIDTTTPSKKDTTSPHNKDTASPPQESNLEFEDSNFDDMVHDLTDMFVESIYDAMNSSSYYDYHHSITKGKKSNKEKSGTLASAGLSEHELPPVAFVDLNGKVKDNFEVDMDDNQRQIITLLNKLKWNKYPIIIRKTRATHAAAINRHSDPNFVEGKVVVAHFVNEVFKV